MLIDIHDRILLGHILNAPESGLVRASEFDMLHKIEIQESLVRVHRDVLMMHIVFGERADAVVLRLVTQRVRRVIGTALCHFFGQFMVFGRLQVVIEAADAFHFLRRLLSLEEIVRFAVQRACRRFKR